MPKDHPIGIRFDPDVKTALERAAHEDERSVSTLVRIIVTEWLRAKGLVASPPGKGKRGKKI